MGTFRKFPPPMLSNDPISPAVRRDAMEWLRMNRVADHISDITPAKRSSTLSKLTSKNEFVEAIAGMTVLLVIATTGLGGAYVVMKMCWGLLKWAHGL